MIFGCKRFQNKMFELEIVGIRETSVVFEVKSILPYYMDSIYLHPVFLPKNVTVTSNSFYKYETLLSQTYLCGQFQGEINSIGNIIGYIEIKKADFLALNLQITSIMFVLFQGSFSPFSYLKVEYINQDPFGILKRIKANEYQMISLELHYSLIEIRQENNQNQEQTKFHLKEEDEDILIQLPSKKRPSKVIKHYDHQHQKQQQTRLKSPQEHKRYRKSFSPINIDILQREIILPERRC